MDFKEIIANKISDVINIGENELKKYIEENFNENDVMLVQGNWGYTYNIVKWSIEKKLVPVYSYTERNVEEIKDGENVKKISYFKHVKFIKYD